MAKSRNVAVDVIRGVAILMVVLGHTVTGSTQGFENALAYNVIWSVQMPLFMVISGYVTRYSKAVETAGDLLDYVKKRSLAYLVPFVSATVLVKALILGGYRFLNPLWLAYHMDSGYWFLFSLWVMTVMFGVACFLSRQKCFARFASGVISQCVITLFIFGVLSLFLLSLGILFGLSFLGIKLTLYYIPFFLLGYVASLFSGVQVNGRFMRAWRVLAAVCAVAYAVLILRVNTVLLEDTLFDVALRMLVSLLGCGAICGLLPLVLRGGRVTGAFAGIGQHTLEIYTLHYLFLSLLKPAPLPSATTAAGAALVLGNFLLTLALTLALSYLLSKSRHVRLVLFGKTK